MAADPDNALLDDYFGPLSPEWVPDTPTDNGIPITTVPVPKLYGDSLFGKFRGARIDQGSPNWLRLVLYSPQTGAPVKIAIGSYSTDPTVDIRYREASGYNLNVYGPDTGDTPYLTPDGLSVVLPVPVELRDNPGVYDAQVRVVDANAVERNRSSFLLAVDRGLWLSAGTVPSGVKGPPTFDEIRTSLRDHPGVNRLLQNFEFDLGEIGQSIVWAVQTYNQTSPIGSCNYTTVSWPSAWRRQLLDGCLSYLFNTASTYFRRGHLPYSAGGLQIDDLNKENEYDKAAMAYRTRFEEWCRLTKTRMSIDAGWGSVAGGMYNYGDW